MLTGAVAAVEQGAVVLGGHLHARDPELLQPRVQLVPQLATVQVVEKMVKRYLDERLEQHLHARGPKNFFRHVCSWLRSFLHVLQNKNVEIPQSI